jgi:hypothetical protein
MSETETPAPVGSDDLLARLPHTADGKPILLGDVVYVENPDGDYFGRGAILEVKVHYMSNDIGFVEYKGTVTIGGCSGAKEWEGGNLDCFTTEENALRGGANV